MQDSRSTGGGDRRSVADCRCESLISISDRRDGKAERATAAVVVGVLRATASRVDVRSMSDPGTHASIYPPDAVRHGREVRADGGRKARTSSRVELARGGPPLEEVERGFQPGRPYQLVVGFVAAARQ
jgi:hypothetical protein